MYRLIYSELHIYIFKVVENLLDSRLGDGGDCLVSERAQELYRLLSRFGGEWSFKVNDNLSHHRNRQYKIVFLYLPYLGIM